MLPGVPREMRGMLADTIIPHLRDRLPLGGPVIRARTLRTANIAESALADKLGDLARGVNGLSLAYLPGIDGVDLRLTSYTLPARETEAALTAAALRVREKVGRFVYGEGDDDLAALRVAEVVTHPVHEEVVAADDLEFEDVVAFAELLAVLQL